MLAPEPGPVVAREEDERALGEAQLPERPENASHARVQLLHDVAVQPSSALPAESIGWVKRDVRERIGDIKEEGRSLPLAEEAKGLVRGAARERFLPDGRLDDLRPPEEGHGRLALLGVPHVVRVRETEELVEALSRGQELAAMPEVPLPDHHRRVTTFLEDFGERDLVGAEAARRVGEEHSPLRGAHAGPDRVATREERGAARSADRRGRVELREAHALRGHPVELGRANRRMPVAAEVAVAQVIREEDHEVGRHLPGEDRAPAEDDREDECERAALPHRGDLRVPTPRAPSGSPRGWSPWVQP